MNKCDCDYNSYSCNIDLDSIYEKLYAMCIEWTKLSERENRSSTTW